MPAPGRRGDGSAGDAKRGEWPGPEDEQRPEHDVDDVRQPEHPHGDGGVSRAAEDRVGDEEDDDRRLAAEHDDGVGASGRDHGGRGAHEGEKPGREQRARCPQHDRHDQGERQGLDGGARGSLGILLPDPPRDHRRGADAESHGERVDDGEQRLGEPHGGDGIGPETADPEDVRHREDAFQHHLEHHRNGEQQHRPADRSHGEVVMHFAADRFADDGPEADRVRAGGRQ